MKIKNKKTGELIEVPNHLEEDVRKAIKKGKDPMSVLPKAVLGIKTPFTNDASQNNQYKFDNDNSLEINPTYSSINWNWKELYDKNNSNNTPFSAQTTKRYPIEFSPISRHHKEFTEEGYFPLKEDATNRTHYTMGRMINLGDTTPKYYDFGEGTYDTYYDFNQPEQNFQNTPENPKTNFTYPAQDFGDIDESKLVRPQEQSFTMPSLDPVLIPEKNQTLEFNSNPQGDKSKINFKNPHLNLLPTMGNKYLNRGVQYANNALNHAFAINTNPNSWEQPLNYYNGISNAPLTADVKSNTMAYGGLQGAGTATNVIQSGINFGKGTLDIIGSQLQNNQVQNMENQLYTQSVFSGAIDNRPNEIYGYSNLGRNALAENGLQIKEIGGQGQMNTEVEDLEHIKLPNGFSQEISGKKHSEGGIPLNLPVDSKVFSEKLKVTTEKGKKSYADMAKPFETKKHFDMLNAKAVDPIQKSTAEMMIKFKNTKLEELFNKQEEDKIAGLHGSKVQNETLGEYGFGGNVPIENEIMKYDNGGKAWIKKILEHERQWGQPGGTPDTQGIYADEQWTGVNADRFQKYIDAVKAEIPNFDKLPEAVQATLVDYKFNNGNRSIKDLLLRAEGKITGEQLNSNQKFDITPNYKLLENSAFVKKIAIAKEDAYLSQAEKNKPGFQGNFDNNFFPRSHMWDNWDNSQNVPSPTYTPEQLLSTKIEPIVDRFTGVNPNFNLNTFHLSPYQISRRDEFLPFTPENTPDIYGNPLFRDNVFKDFEFRTGIKLNRNNTDDKNLEDIRNFQNAITPELTRDYKLNFTRGNQDLYNEFTKQKGYKKAKDNTKESNNFYDWAVANKKLNNDYVDKGKWGHEYYNTAPLNFETEAEYNKWKQDPDWEQVGNRFVDRSGNPNGIITYYDVHKNWENKQATPDTKTTDPTITEKIIYKQPNYNIDPTLNVEFPLPNVYSRTPLNYYQVDPNYIDPRYLDIQPQLNEIQRGQRAFQNNLGDRGTASISNLLQSQVNAYNNQQQAYGNKYNYDRGQDAQTQQFNAQMKTNVDQYNQQSWYNQLENPIRMRESNIGDQELKDQYRGLERADQKLAFNNTKNYIDKTIPYYNNMSQEDRVAMMEILARNQKKEEPKKGKNGGIIKLKLKKKS